jgi:hypothetical protein
LLKFDTDGTTAVDSMVTESNNKIGIGLANATRTLSLDTGSHVYQSFNVGGAEKAVIGTEVGVNRRFIVYDAEADLYRLVVDETGNVGVGTPTPTRKLTLDTGSHVYQSFNVGGLERAIIGSEVGVNRRFLIYDGVAGVYRLVVDETGRVGVGTTVPTEKLEVAGNVKSNGALISTVATGTPPLSVTSQTQVPNLNASFLGGMSAAAARTRGIVYLGGCDTCSPLADADDQRTIYLNVVGPMTIESVTCFSDLGTPVINLQRDDGSPANVLAADLSCSAGGTTTGDLSLSESVLNFGEKLDFVMVSAGGTAKRVTVAIKTTVN